jgi:hypothetical protein
MSALAGRSCVRDVVCAVGVAVAIVLGAVSGDARASFGIASSPPFTASAVEQDGLVDTRAGSHPYEYVVTVNLDENDRHEVEGDLRDALTDLPPGLIGDPRAVPRCPVKDFDGPTALCPGDTQVGWLEASVEDLGEPYGPIYNLVPPAGVPARLGFSGYGLTAILDGSVRTGAGYGVRVSVDNVPTEGVKSVTARIWGVPAEASHDGKRQCFEEKNGIRKIVSSCSSEVTPAPFLRLPTSCNGPLTTTLSVDSVEEPGVFDTAEAQSLDAGGNPVGLFGCEALPFDPSFALRPEASGTEEPSGLNVELKVPQPESPEGLAEADLQGAEVVLPEGVTVSPSAANGLTGCALEGSEGVNLASPEPARCPGSSKVGTVRIRTPLLEEELEGSVFVSQQGNLPGHGSNPFGSLIAIYLVAEGDGVVAKIPGEISLQEGTGRLTARFGEDPTTGEEGLPQLPFSELRMSFFGGARAALVTPTACGTYVTSAKLTPWSGTAPVEADSYFTIDHGCSGSGFAPSFAANTTGGQARAYSPLVEVFSRNDGEQHFNGFEETLPEGVLAKIAGVPRCGEAEASAGACPEASRIGTVTVGTGPGSDPLFVGGSVYLTGPYNGGPFGFVVEVPAIAGPFDLDQDGMPVTVRGSIRIDPVTAQATIVSDPFPTMLQGVPLDIRSVRVAIDRPEFTFNASDCVPLSTTGTLGSTNGASATVSSPYEAVNCATLPFNPSFKVSTSAHTSKANGASLHVAVAQGAGEADIHRVDVSLPLALPARLTTLQKACTERQFAADPAGCPEASFVGVATAHTPLLASALTGPAILVSHGGAAFPDLVIILQGEGVKVVLTGNTDIKKGVTYSRFETIPDAPISSFELSLPQGPHSALAANTSLCAQPLTMPTEMTGQNGALLKRSTAVEVEGCPTTIAIAGETVKKRTLTLKLYVPAAGRVKVGGRGLRTTTKTAKGRETLTIDVNQKRAGHLRTRLTVLFTPATGRTRARQAKTLKVAFKK